MATYSSATKNYYTLQLTVTESAVDTASNRSTLSYSLVLKTGSTYFDTVKVGYTIKIDGTTVASLNYSDATAKSMGRNSSWTIKSGTSTVTHNSDGTKSIAAGAITASLNTATGNIVPNLSLSNSSALVLTTIPRASTVSTTATSTLMGVTNGRTITVSRKSTNYAHMLTYTFGSASGNITSAKTTSETITWTVPTSLAAQVEAGAIRKSGTITCTTYASTSSTTVIGTSTCSFVAQIPPTTPTVTSAIASSVTMGNAAAISLAGRAASKLTHKLTYSFNSGAETGTIVASTSATSYSWTVPTSLAANVTAGTTNSACVITCTTYNGTASVGTKTVTLNHVYIPKSTFTLTGSPVTVGTGSLTINITRAAPNLTHNISYSPDGTNWTSIVTRTTETSFVWSPGHAVAAAISGTSATWHIAVGTYNYSSSSATGSVGSNSTTFTIRTESGTETIPIPTTTCSSSITSGTFAGLYIQGNSTLKVTYSGKAANDGATTPTYYATLASYSLKVGGTTVKSGALSTTTMSGTYTTPTLTTTGSVTVSLTLTDNHGFSATHTQTVTVQAYKPTSLGPKSGGTKIIVGRATASGSLSASGTHLHIECSRTISQIKNGSNTQLNYGYLHYSMDGSTWTAIGSGTTAASADGTVAAADIPLNLSDSYTVRLRAYDTFGGTANASIVSFKIPTDVVFLDTQNASSGLGVGMYSQGAARLDVAWNTHFERVVRPNLLSSHDITSDTQGRSYVWLCPQYSFTDVGLSDSVTSPFNTYLEAWIKTVCAGFPSSFDALSITVEGTARPGVRGTIFCNIRDTTDLSGGLPRYSSGAFYPINGSTEVIRFGTWEYAFFYSVINGNETGTLTYVSNSVITSAANLGMTLKKSGKVVTLNATSTTVAGVAASSLVTVASLPSGFYPSGANAVVTAPQQATTAGNIISLYATTDGLLRVIKIGTSTAAWRATLMWLTA